MRDHQVGRSQQLADRDGLALQADAELRRERGDGVVRIKADDDRIGANLRQRTQQARAVVQRCAHIGQDARRSSRLLPARMGLA